jgi:hypothetical protein
MSSEYAPFAKRCKSRACGEPTKRTPLSIEATLICGYLLRPILQNIARILCSSPHAAEFHLYFGVRFCGYGSLRLSSGEGDCASVALPLSASA